MRRLLGILAAAILLASPAAARVLRVVGVAVDDVLNLREQPSPSARIVGAIPPGGRGVEVLRGEGGPWLLVRWGDLEGWALATYLATDMVVRPRRGQGPVAPGAAGGWLVLLGSFADPAGTPASIAVTSERARQCGLRPFAAPSGSLPGLRPGLTVVAAGPFPTRAAAESARAQVAACIPGAYVRSGALAVGAQRRVTLLKGSAAAKGGMYGVNRPGFPGPQPRQDRGRPATTARLTAQARSQTRHEPQAATQNGRLNPAYLRTALAALVRSPGFGTLQSPHQAAPGGASKARQGSLAPVTLFGRSGATTLTSLTARRKAPISGPLPASS